MIGALKKSIESRFPKRKRKCIEDWDFIFVFQQYYKIEIQLMFSKLKCQEDIEWTVVSNQKEKQVLFLVKISERVVKNMAHQLKILKVKDKHSFRINLKQINLYIYSTDPQSNPNVYNYLCFLRARLRPQNKQIYEQQKLSPFNKLKESKFIKQQDGKLFSSQQQLRAKYHFLLTYIQKNTGNQNQFNTNDTNKQPFNSIIKHPGFIQLVPIQKVSEHRTLILDGLKQYVGPNMDCYFQFVSFMQKWLIFPMIVGLLTIGLNYFYDYDADNSPFDFIYALVIMLWSILFITRWEEIQRWTKVKETCGRSEIWTERQDLISKDLYQKKQSRTTGKIEHHMPFKTRILLTISSNFVCFMMMVFTLIFIVYSLNARGFIDPDHKLFYSQFVSSLSASGGIFDSNTILGQIPNIIHVLVTNGFDQNVYRPIAKKLSKLERHQSRKGYQNSIILKYFIYQFVITFADLFYIAFVRLDIQGLRQQLLSLFFIDIVRRVVAESVIPWIKHRKSKSDSYKYVKSSSMTKNINYQKDLMSKQEQLQWGAILEVNKQNYEQFDDYLQIITNMGYLVMISSCFPLAPLLILIAHQVELIQDKYKIIHIFKRKLPECYVGMGRWKDIIVFLCYISIITNIMLFAFSSQQVVSFFPMMYQSGKDLLYGNTDLSTIIGGAATNLFQNFLEIQNITGSNTNIINDILNFTQPQISPQIPVEDVEKIINFNINQAEVPSQYENVPELDQNSCKNPGAFQQIKLSKNQGVEHAPIIVKQFKPPKKQSQLTFMAILFFIQHFFLLLFIFLRDALKRRKSEAQIFTQRRQYKRRIKKNLPKDILSKLSTMYLVSKMITENEKNQKQKQVSQTQANTQLRLKASQRTTSTATGSGSWQQQMLLLQQRRQIDKQMIKKIQ